MRYVWSEVRVCRSTLLLFPSLVQCSSTFHNPIRRKYVAHHPAGPPFRQERRSGDDGRVCSHAGADRRGLHPGHRSVGYGRLEHVLRHHAAAARLSEATTGEACDGAMMSSHASPLDALQLFGFMTFAHSWMGVAFGAVFTALMAVAAAYDLRERRIPNAVVLATAATGAVFTILTLGIRALVFRFLGGAATGLVIWLPFWWAGLMGAGDVKIFAAA